MAKTAATATKAKTPVNRLSQIGKTSYNWVDRDPVLDEICRIIIASGKSVEWIEAETVKIGRKVSRYTLLGWLYKVKRPQNFGLDSVCMVLGVKREFVYEDGSKFTIPQIDLAKAKFLRDPTFELAQIEPAYSAPQALPAPMTEVHPVVTLKAKAKVPARTRKGEPA